MRSARMLLAMLALAALAACGTDSITAPDAAGVRRSVEGNPSGEETTQTTQGTSTTTTLDCAGELVTRLTESGLVTECIAKGQYGSGSGN